MKRYVVHCVVLGCLAMALLVGCGDSGQVGPLSDTLPLEIPTSISEDADAIRSATVDASIGKRVERGGEYSQDVTRAGDNLFVVTTDIDRVLEQLDALELPSSTSTTTASFIFDVPAIIQQQYDMPATIDVAADFRDFDIDDDGDNEGCSGNSFTVPICLRLWLDDTRTIAAMFTDKPTAISNGAGRLIIDDTVFSEDEAGKIFGFLYDHTDADDRTTELFSGTAVEGTVAGAGIDTHIVVQVTGDADDDDSAIKTVSYTSEFDVGHPDGLTETQSIVRWTDDGGVLSGAFANDLTNTTLDPQCIDLVTGERVDDVNACAAVSIADEAYVSLANDSDYHLPSLANFPELPNF